MSHASKNLNPTEKLKELLEELYSENGLYLYLLREEIFVNYSKTELEMRIAFLTEEIQMIKKEFSN